MGPGHGPVSAPVRLGSLLDSRAFFATLVFVCAFAVGADSLLRSSQLGYLRGLADRWLALSLNVAAHGVLGERREPTVFKPPGYPLLVSAVLRTFVGRPPATESVSTFSDPPELVGLALPFEKDYVQRAVRAVYWSNCEPPW